MKFKLPSWKKGEEFIQEMASKLDIQIEVRDARKIIETPTVRISFHPDDRGFAFISCKISDDHIKTQIVELKKKFLQ